VLPGAVATVAYALPKSAPVTQCQLISGPLWQSPSQPASGNTYTVNVIGHAFSCKAAMTWAAKLIKDPAKTPSGLPVYHFALKNGPPGRFPRGAMCAGRDRGRCGRSDHAGGESSSEL
jgi:hypothetical protein